MKLRSIIESEFPTSQVLNEYLTLSIDKALYNNAKHSKYYRAIIALSCVDVALPLQRSNGTFMFTFKNDVENTSSGSMPPAIGVFYHGGVREYHQSSRQNWTSQKPQLLKQFGSVDDLGTYEPLLKTAFEKLQRIKLNRDKGLVSKDKGVFFNPWY